MSFGIQIKARQKTHTAVRRCVLPRQSKVRLRRTVRTCTCTVLRVRRAGKNALPFLPRRRARSTFGTKEFGTKIATVARLGPYQKSYMSICSTIWKMEFHIPTERSVGRWQTPSRRHLLTFLGVGADLRFPAFLLAGKYFELQKFSNFFDRKFTVTTDPDLTTLCTA